MSPFEAIMLICFGVSWPVAIWKTLKTRSVHGKSKTFLALVAIGYASGISHKAVFSFDWVIFLYGFNFLMVLTELSLCLLFASRQEQASANVYAAADTLFDSDEGVQQRPHRQTVRATSHAKKAPHPLTDTALRTIVRGERQ